ncbi:MAG: glycosyl transferase [Dysgonamonadaceae bacterium]|nr:glycosyl transferase [Dysgonamonadaceae bacterium]
MVKEIYSCKNFFSRHPIVIIADPFLFAHNNELYLFYEEQIDLYGKGVIKMIKTSDLEHWSKPEVVLEEAFHLSYPNVFTIGTEIFMMPETGYDNSIKLYKPNVDLTAWKPYKTLLTRKQFKDSSIIYYESKYYLFTTDYTEKANILRLYYSSSIDEEWIEHPKSPIATDSNTGRCAGSLFFYQDKLYRPCQRCKPQYGAGADIYQVDTLTTVDYSERKIVNIIPNSDKFYRQGGHHFNLCEFNGKLIVATDGIENRLNFFEIIRRIKDKFFT